MEKNKIAVGLDIGTTKIVALIGKRNEHGKIEILGSGYTKSIGVKRGVVVNITQTIQSIRTAIEEAEEMSGFKVEKVSVGIAGQHIRSLHHSDYISRDNPDEVINEADIERLIAQVHKLGLKPGEEIIHVIPQDYKVDTETEIREPIGMYGSRVEANFHVVVGQISSIRNLGRCITDAGYKLSNITLEPLASAESVLSEDEKEAGVALIDIGGGTTDLAIFKDGIIKHTAVIPFGGNVVTHDIKEGCAIIEKQAELLKVKFGSAWPKKNKANEVVSVPGLRGREPKEISLLTLSNIIHARITEIIEHVFQEIKKYANENHNGQLIAGIVLTGGGSQIKHLKQLVEYITGLDTRIGMPDEHLAPHGEEKIASPIYATSVGLLMAGLDELEKLPVEEEEAEPETVAEKVTPDEETQDEKEEDQAGEESQKASKKTSFFDKFKTNFLKFFDDAE